MKDLNTLLKSLTIEEKIGQMIQLAPFFFIGDLEKEVYGPIQALKLSEAEVFLAGSVLGIGSAEEMIKVQSAYLNKSRHKIPLIFMADIIHGYKTIFPVPLAMASSFNPSLVEKAARISAIEAQTAGIHVTFSPMSDLTRDPRWGRVVEGFGEDPYLNQVYSSAMVKGYQQDDVSKEGHLASCVKHFAGYGESEAGRDYNTVDMSRLKLHQYYLSGYKAAIDAGARLVMTAFNIFEGVPATTNKYLLRDLLKSKWGFDGVVISDYDSLRQTIEHGTSENDYDAAKKAIQAGLDIEMATSSFMLNLKHMIESNEIETSLIDDAVMRILKLKQDLGLFDDPFKGASKQKEIDFVLSQTHKDIALEVAKQSMVLLKNDAILPLKLNTKIAIIGTYARDKDTIGPWSWHGKSEDCITLEQACSTYADIVYVNATNQVETINYNILSDVDYILCPIGEKAIESGEAHSKTNPTLSQSDIELVKALKAYKKKLIVILYNGRPLVLTDILEKSDAILETFFLGTMAQQAIAQTIFGINNPSGKLTMSFPRSVGQIPIYYNHLNTGRPFKHDGNPYTSYYLDETNEPLFAFGFGLSYSTFELSEPILSSNKIKRKASISVIMHIRNVSNVAGYETVQLYIKDQSAEVSRPIKELKAFKKIFLNPYESKEVVLHIDETMLAYHHSDLSYSADLGTFIAMIGTSSKQTKNVTFELIGG
jgi:beta-glucosidase